MSESAPSPTGRAVFLSYAREDSEAARRIADALRAFGVEVWFDLDELRGGDSWDAKIKRQIRECTLFVPIISATTQARGEGYFRREWKLGVERTHDMAASRTFLLPVLLDDVSESEADVPEEFLRVQWTRLPHGVPSPEFVAQVKRVLDSPRSTPATARFVASTPPYAATANRESASATPAAITAPRSVTGRNLGVAALAIAVVGTAAALYFVRRPTAPTVAVAVPPAGASTLTATTVPRPLVPDAKSVAVLPFENMSEEKDSGFFADGIHEDVLTNLAYIRDLHVISRTSVMQYRGTTKPIRQIARELNVAYILEGSVRRVGNKVRVTGQLINAATDEHVWAKAYDRDVSDIFAVQEDIAHEIANAMSAALSPAEKTLLARRPTENLAAYDAYVKARQLREQGALTMQKEAEGLLRRAVELDPKFAQAWSELGALIALRYFSEVDQTAARLAEAKAAIETAMNLAPDDPVVIEGSGDYYYYGYRDYERAVEQYERLAVMRPNDPVVARSLGLIHRRQGRWPEALAELKRAAELEPSNVMYWRNLYSIAEGLRLFDEADTAHRHAIELTNHDLAETGVAVFGRCAATGSLKEAEEWLAQLPSHGAQDALVMAFRKNGAAFRGDFAGYVELDRQRRYIDDFAQSHGVQDANAAMMMAAAGDRAAAHTRAQEAVAELTAEIEKQPTNASLWSNLGIANAVLGNRDEALRTARKAMELVPEARDALAGPQYRQAYDECLAWLGDKDAAITELDHLLHVPFGENMYVARYSAGWFPLRGDPRFEALVNDPKNNAPLL